MTEPPRRGRPRSVDADRRILDAALEEYAERGWHAFTMDAVARRARVGKSTVYLRWRDKDVLLIDAAAAHASALTDVDTGSLRGDLVALGCDLLQMYAQPLGWALLRLTMDAKLAPASFQAYRDHVSAHRARVARQVVTHALERGDLEPDDDTESLLSALYGALTMQVLRYGPDWHPEGPEIAQVTERIVDFLLRRPAD